MENGMNGMKCKKIVKVLWIMICMVLFLQITSSTVYAASSTDGVKNLIESTATIESISLKWSKMSGVSGYQVYRSTSKSGNYRKVATIMGETVISYKDTELVAGKTYYYKVRAFTMSGNNMKYGAFSKMLSAVTKPDKITDLGFTVTEYGSVIFNWSSVPGASKYNVYYSSSKNGTYKLSGTTTKTTYEYFSTSTDTFYFKVAAVRSSNSYEAVGKYSNTIPCSDIWGMSIMVANANYNQKKFGFSTYTIFNASEVYDRVISTVAKKIENNDFLLDDISDSLFFYCPKETDISAFQNSRQLYDTMSDKTITSDNYGSYVLAYENNLEMLFKQNYDNFFHKKAVTVIFATGSFNLFNIIQVKLISHSTGDEYLKAEEKAKSIAASFSGTAYEEVKFAYDYLINNATYDYQERDNSGSNQRAHSAYGALIDKLCVCDGYSEAFYLLMEAYGIPCNIVVNENHAWNEVMLDGKWYLIDVTNKMFLFGQDIMKASTDITYSDFSTTYIWSTQYVAYYGYAASGNSTNITLSETSYFDRQVSTYWSSGYYYSSILAS